MAEDNIERFFRNLNAWRPYMMTWGISRVMAYRVAASRNVLAGKFPLPDPYDCVRYAITEAGEYVDAMLRMERTKDKRNNGKELSPGEELAQCGYMLFSAMIQLAPEAHIVQPKPMCYHTTTRLDGSTVAAACALTIMDGGVNYNRLLSALAAYEETARLYSESYGGYRYYVLYMEDVCAKFEAKHSVG